MNIKEYLKDEIKRLNCMNDLLEKEINQGRAVNNVKAMCDISLSLRKWY